ncbi:MAG: signal recognition particle-docking protein FtsY, partial [Verrucomicrobiota bacterium]
MSFWKKLVQKFVPGATADSATPIEVDREIDWEALLLEADLGLTLTQKWTRALEDQKLLKKPLAAEQYLRQEMLKLLEPPAYRLILDKPEVIMLVGVIGSGKTTSAAK